jgi:hypothetical protein
MKKMAADAQIIIRDFYLKSYPLLCESAARKRKRTMNDVEGVLLYKI